MENLNSKPDTGSAFLNQLGWFIGLNLAWVLLALLAIWMGWRSYNLSVNGEVATGIVTSLVETDGSDFFADIYPVVDFEVDGNAYSVRSQNNYRWWNRYTRFSIGKQVEMRYVASNPKNAEINSWWDIWGETIILAVFTTIAALAVNVYLIFRWRSRRAAPVSV